MAGRTIASYHTLIYLFTFITVGEILCQDLERFQNPERFQIPLPRPRYIATTAELVGPRNIINNNNNNKIVNNNNKIVNNNNNNNNNNKIIKNNNNNININNSNNGNNAIGGGPPSKKQPEKATTPKPPTSVQELFNSSSCVEPPFTCPHPRIQFFLYTRLTQENPELLDVTNQESLYATHFNPKYPVKIIIHGFQGGRNLSPSTDLRDAYFTRGNYNIIVVDYSTLAKIPCLSQMEWAPRFCGMCIAQLANYLAEHPRGVPPDKLHLMGYSVGAHIAGLTSNFIKSGKIGRITGLDPTIIFYMSNNRSRDLDPTDAHFVDIIHTAAGILGQWGASGHADFYVNGGTSQPGCASDSIIQTLSCDHTKVTPYFIESINSNVGFWAVPCSNRFYFNLGLCDPPESQFVLMGEHVTHKARGIYYLNTNAKKPYARGFPKQRSSPATNIG